MYDAPYVIVQDVWLYLGMAVLVDPGSPFSSGAVIRKQLFVGYILLH